MGKLTAEQKAREYNRGQKAASEGRSRSWSEPWAYPLESNQHYEERREAFNQGYGIIRHHAHVCPAISSVISAKPARVQALLRPYAFSVSAKIKRAPLQRGPPGSQALTARTKAARPPGHVFSCTQRVH
jgi:hypothetical protein